MMKFKDFPYKRPDVEVFSKDFYAQLEVFIHSENAEQQIECIEKINAIRSTFDTMHQICMIRHTIDTTDKFYTSEQGFFDEQSPRIEELISKYYRALIDTPFRTQLEKHFGAQLFRIAELSLRTFSPEIIDLLIEENKLGTRYTEILASASIPFDGKELNLSEFGPYLRNTDRTIRKSAAEARWGFLEEKATELEDLYGNLVRTRDEMARKLGYSNFVQMGYDRMLRTDYNEEKSAFYRAQIKEHVVPLATALRKEQASRLGLDALKYYDEALQFKDGNAAPKGDPDWIINNGKKLYEELSPKTGEFIHYMMDNGLMDLVAKKGKAGGGYCTFITGHGAPFIFSNFNGTSSDIDVLTHEVGHAFQVYLSRNQQTMEYCWPTSDAAEIHSMSMEYFTYPYMDLFFNGQSDKYRYSHTTESILFLPYGAAVDEFQHVVYNNPKFTNEERNNAWKEIEQKYLPTRDFDGAPHLSKGTWWQTQSHIFQSPFYYIDYTLAQVCAFQFWVRAMDNPSQAFEDYIKLCKQGGSKSFLELVESSGLESPFDEHVVEKVVSGVKDWLNNFDRTLI